MLPPYKLASREWQRENTVVRIGDCQVGGDAPVVIAGPCAVEDEEMLVRLACRLKAMGVHMLRGGAYKPRTSPYTFQGLGAEGLRMLHAAGRAAGLPVVTELTDVRHLAEVCRYADVIQIGSRNMQNFGLLREVGRLRVPVLLKRGFAATIEEWLLAAEYILVGGNREVILCERGIRSFEPYTRNTFDINAVAAVKHLSHLPLVADPSHGTGRRELVLPVARAALAAGADGVMLEVHPQPDKALSDGPQSLLPGDLAGFMEELRGAGRRRPRVIA